MIATAIARQASDLHIISDGKAVRVLYRIDGVLIESAEYDRLPVHLRWLTVYETRTYPKR